MPDRPLTVHCSGLGGGLLSPDHEYDLFFQNHAQMKVYGPSLAMTDDWEQHITQLGLTKTTHEYAIHQLLSTAVGWGAWKEFLPDRFANLKLLITRAIRLLTLLPYGRHMRDLLTLHGSQRFVKSLDVTIHRANCCWCGRVSPIL